MLKKLSMLAALVAMAGLALAALATPASAQEPEAGDVFLRGRGVLDASGNGLAAVKGAMDYHVTADAGVLLVKDIGGGAEIEVHGYGDKAHWNGFTVYFGFDGTAEITGRDVAVIVIGRDIDLHVAGKGWAYLKGHGTFEVNGRQGRWTEEGTFLGIAPPPVPE